MRHTSGRMVSFFMVAAVLLFIVPAAGRTFADTTPVEKVIDLLTNLKEKVEKEEQEEGAAYEKFACFCHSTTETKATAITTGRANIDGMSATITQKTAKQSTEETELAKAKSRKEADSIELQETISRCKQEKDEADLNIKDLRAAVTSLEKAIDSMKKSKTMLLQGASPREALPLAARQSILQSLALAQILNIGAQSSREPMQALLQVDPDDAGFKYHSQGIIKTLEDLLVDFTKSRDEAVAEQTKKEQTCTDTKNTLNGKIDADAKIIQSKKLAIGVLKGEIAAERDNLISEQESLKDDQHYMQDLTRRCEARANDWDQRSQLRKDEIEALGKALALMEDKAEKQTDALKRAMLVQEAPTPKKALPTGTPAVKPPASQGVGAFPVKAPSARSSPAAITFQPSAAPVSFLQGSATSSVDAASAATRILRGARGSALGVDDRKHQLVMILGAEGKRLGSTALAMLAMHVAEDPFLKVKDLIQKLIERLVKESTEEATKRGFCNTEVGKAETSRDARFEDTNNLDNDIQELNVKESELTSENAVLKREIKVLGEEIDKAVEDRKTEKANNANVIKQAKDGRMAVAEAIDILKVFYAKASRATVLIQASPVDDDIKGKEAGFEGAYKGSQEESTGIIGMLEVIHADFDRTLRKTEAAEKLALAQFNELTRSAKSDKAGKEKLQTLNEEELKTTQDGIKSKSLELKNAQSLLDSSLKRIEVLKPVCIDSGMPYALRVQKRQGEIDALKKALDFLK